MTPTDMMPETVVLKSFAQILKFNTRKSNICGRLGGEEFLVIITHVAKENVDDRH